MKKILFSLAIVLGVVGFAHAHGPSFSGGGGGTDAITLHNIAVTEPAAGDDGKYLLYNHGGPSYDWDTPAGGGDMTAAVWDGDTDGFIDADAGGTDIDTSAATGVPSIAAGTWSVAATLTHELGGLEADASAYDGLVKITGGSTSAVTVTAFAESILDDANEATFKATVNLEAGTDFYAIAAADAAFEAELDNSAGLLAALSDETGTGVAVFGTNPTLTGVTLAGDVTSTGTAVDWDLVDNNASALSFDAAGKAGIIAIVTTDAGEGVTMSGTLNVTGAVTSGGVLTATAAGANITAADGQLINLSGITHTGATDEGFVLPTWADVVPTTDQAYLAYDTAANAIKVYDGGWLSFATEAAPLDAKYIVQQLDATLTGEQALGVLASGILYSTTTTGIVSIATEAQMETTMGVAFGTSKVNTSGYIWVADGTDFESVAMSGDVAIVAGGATTIQADSVALTTDTTGNYTATIADAGNTTITVVNGTAEGGAVTLDAVDLNCSDCLNATEIEDIYVLLAGDTVAGNMVWNGTQTFAGAITLNTTISSISTADEFQAEAGNNIVFQMGDALGANYVEFEDSGGTMAFRFYSDGTMQAKPSGDPYTLWDDDTLSTEFASYANDTTVDRLEFGTTTDAMADIGLNFTYGAYLDVNGNWNVTGQYQVDGAQIDIGDLAAGGNWTPTGTIDLSSSTDTTYKDGTVDIADINATGTPGSGNFLRGDGSWQTSTATLASLSDTADVDYTGGTLLIGDNTDSFDEKVVSGHATLAASGALTVVDFATTAPAVIGEDLAINLDAADEEISIAQSSATGTADTPLIAINDDRTGATADVVAEATIWIDAEGAYAIAAVDGAIYAETLESGDYTISDADPVINFLDSDTDSGAQLAVTADPSDDGVMYFYVDVADTLTLYQQLDGGNERINWYFGSNKDIWLRFQGTNSTGNLYWMEDEAEFRLDSTVDVDGAFTASTVTSDAGVSGTTGTFSSFLNGLTKTVTVAACEGYTEDGGADSNTLATDSGETLVADAYIGMEIYNTTDASSCTVTDNSTTTWTCDGLAGGTDNLFQNGDAIALGPGPNQSGTMFFMSTATTILHPSTAGYVAGYFVAAAAIMKVDPESDSMTINFTDDGVYTDPGAGDEIDSEAAAGDFIVILNQSVTEAHSLGINGSWADGGAS